MAAHQQPDRRPPTRAAVSEPLPWGDVGDLAEELVPIAVDLMVAAGDEGQDAVRGALLRVLAIDPPAAVANTPGGVWGAFSVVLAGLLVGSVDPDQPISRLLAWTEALYPDGGDRHLRPVQ